MDMGAIAVRLGLYLALMILFGLSSFGLYALRDGERQFGVKVRFAPLLAGAAIISGLLSILGILTLAASMAGVSLTAVDRPTVSIVLWGTAVGTAWQVRMVMLVMATVLAFVGIRYPRSALAGIACAAGTAIATLAWTGHGAMDQGVLGWVHLFADIAHLLAAGIWIGALVGLMLLVFRTSAQVDRDHLVLSHRVLEGFSTVGTAVVAVILISGLINSWVLVGVANIPALPNSPYGQLLMAKIALFAAMVVLAATNRFYLTPAFKRLIGAGDHARSIGALRRSLTIETGCAIAILGLVAWLGTLEPPASAMS